MQAYNPKATVFLNSVTSNTWHLVASIEATHPGKELVFVEIKTVDVNTSEIVLNVKNAKVTLGSVIPSGEITCNSSISWSSGKKANVTFLYNSKARYTIYDTEVEEDSQYAKTIDNYDPNTQSS